MKNKKSFIIRTISKVMLVVILTAIANAIVRMPTITNEIALGQMANTNMGFIELNAFNAIRPYISKFIYFVAMIVIGNIVYATYIFFKHMKEKTEE